MCSRSRLDAVFPSDVMPRRRRFLCCRLVKTAPGEGGGLEQWRAERADQTLAEDGAEGAATERARQALNPKACNLGSAP